MAKTIGYTSHGSMLDGLGGRWESWAAAERGRRLPNKRGRCYLDSCKFTCMLLPPLSLPFEQAIIDLHGIPPAPQSASASGSGRKERERKGGAVKEGKKKGGRQGEREERSWGVWYEGKEEGKE